MIRWRIGRDPLWNELDNLQRRMDGLLNAISSWRPPAELPLWSSARLFPLLNVSDTGTQYVVTAEIPGIKTEDLDIKIEGDTLTIKGERKAVDGGQNASYHRRERALGVFQRSLTLPKTVDPDNVKATYKDGILTIVLTKSAAAVPRQITITSE